MKKVITLLLTLAAFLYPASLKEWRVEPKRSTGFSSFRLLDAKIFVPDSFDKGDFSGISGIAYDRDEKRLYAVSDNAKLYVIKLQTGENEIEKMDILSLLPLKDRNGDRLKGKKMRDAEGMDLYGEGLLVSFERKPRVILFDKTGREIKRIKIPKPLEKESRYRGRNKMLEAVLFHPGLGILTAPELPLEGAKKGHHTVYGKNVRFHIPFSGSLTAMEITEKGNILVLEREFDPIFGNRVVTLSLIYTEGGGYKEIAKLKSQDGWRLDNFEGLARLEKNRFLMTSDDNENPFQKRLLLLFEISE